MSNDCERLWQQVRVLFEDDDGSLPGIEISNLAAENVVAVYAMLRQGSENCSVDPTFWDIQQQRDRPIDSVPNPAELVVSGRAETFHHCVRGFAVAGVELPVLGIFVFTDCIELNYRAGLDWGPKQVEGLFRLLLTITQMAPRAEVSPETAIMAELRQQFHSAWDEYKATAGSARGTEDV